MDIWQLGGDRWRIQPAAWRSCTAAAELACAGSLRLQRKGEEVDALVGVREDGELCTVLGDL
jgi:hypothetical protein